MPEPVTRRACIAAVAAALAGCGGIGTGDGAGDTTPTSNPAVGAAEQMGELRLTSPAFEDGERIPERYGRDAENVNPPLSIANVPADAESMTLIVDDPDAVDPAGEVWLHWLVWNIPPSKTDIPAGWEPREAVEGTNDFGTRGYEGPDPPDEVHTYRFKLYALDTTLDLAESASKPEVGTAMEDARLSQTQLRGTYAP